MQPTDDTKIIEEFIRGEDRNLIDRIILETVSVQVLTGHIDPDEVIQNSRMALLSIFRADGYQAGNLRAFVRRVAQIQCLQELRRHSRFRKYHKSISGTEDEHADPAPDAETVMAGKQRRAVAKAVLKELGRSSCRLLMLRYVKRLSYKKIGERLSVTEGNARVMVYRCLQKSREIAKRLGEEL